MLILVKSDETHNHSVLFNRIRDLTAEIWFGRRLGQEAAPTKLAVDRALPFDEINEQLYLLLNRLDVIYHAQGQYAYADNIVLLHWKNYVMVFVKSPSASHVNRLAALVA